MFTVPLWPGIKFTPFQILCMDGFFALFFLIGVVIEFFRVKVSDNDIKQGFWPIKNEMLFRDMRLIELSEKRSGSYVAITMKDGKKFRFDSMLESFSYFCQDVAKKGRQNSVEVTVR
ncbi:hypothetical protein GCM10007862_08120 [Dyella lipolytica]|nr:hypothetical protein GCM10007862_08120 [Dyella lipolytica]